MPGIFCHWSLGCLSALWDTEKAPILGSSLGANAVWVRVMMGLVCALPSDSGPRRGLQLDCDAENNIPPNPPPPTRSSVRPCCKGELHA